MDPRITNYQATATIQWEQPDTVQLIAPGSAEAPNVPWHRYNSRWEPVLADGETYAQWSARTDRRARYFYDLVHV
jgi:hypothetical protein